MINKQESILPAKKNNFLGQINYTINAKVGCYCKTPKFEHAL